MSIKISLAFILMLASFLLGCWFMTNQDEGWASLVAFKHYLGRTFRGDGVCPKGDICTKVNPS